MKVRFFVLPDIIIKRICVGMMFIVILLSKGKFHLDFWDAHELLLTTLFLVYFQPPSFCPCFFFFPSQKRTKSESSLTASVKRY